MRAENGVGIILKMTKEAGRLAEKASISQGETSAVQALIEGEGWSTPAEHDEDSSKGIPLRPQHRRHQRNLLFALSIPVLNHLQ